MRQPTSYPPGAPAWVDLATTDPDGARAFYGRLFGWEFEIGAEGQGFYTMCRLRGRKVAGMVGQPSTHMATTWTTYLAIDDADAAAQRITAAGGGLMLGPMDVTDQGRLVIATDPTTAMFGLWQARAHVGATLVDEPGSVTWNELATPDLEAAKAFYSRVFGYAWERVDTGAEGPAAEIFKIDDRLLGGAVQIDEQRSDRGAAHWTPYFAVADTDAAVAAARGSGGAVWLPPTDTPFGRVAGLTDPQGGEFSIIAAG